MTQLNFCIYRLPSTPDRIDTYLAQTLSESRTLIKHFFQQKEIMIRCASDKKPRYIEPSDTPIHQSEITIQNFIPKSARILQPNVDLSIPILFEDDHLLVVNKPRGLSVNALKYTETHSMANFFLARTPTLYDWDTRTLEPGVVHRLDQWTSGCLLGVKTDHVLKAIQAQFKNRTIQKIYLALVEGHITWSDEWSDELIHHPKNHRKMMIVTSQTPKALREKARTAVLSFRPITQQEKHTLVEVRLKTGRMHQIRVQFSHRGYPVLGDRLYGAKLPTSLKGYWLHAQCIEFTHPVTEKRILVTAPLPKDLQI